MAPFHTMPPDLQALLPLAPAAQRHLVATLRQEPDRYRRLLHDGLAIYYGYRYGLYGAWPLYDNDVRTVTYPIGTANIDVVDARQKQMIWEGVAQGRLSDQDMNNPRDSIAQVVTQLFARFPGRPGIVENSRASDVQ